MKPPLLFLEMSDADKLEYVIAQLSDLEEGSARALLEERHLPSDALAVRRLVYTRLLYMSLRLREHSL